MEKEKKKKLLLVSATFEVDRKNNLCAIIMPRKIYSEGKKKSPVESRFPFQRVCDNEFLFCTLIQMHFCACAVCDQSPNALMPSKSYLQSFLHQTRLDLWAMGFSTKVQQLLKAHPFSGDRPPF